MIEGKIIFWIAASAYGVLTWWADKYKKKKEAEELAKRIRENERAGVSTTPAVPAAPAGTLRPAAPPAQSQPQASEQERLRRFLEALGVPGGQSPPVAQRPVAPPPQPRPVPQAPSRPAYQPAPQVRERGQVPASARPAPQPVRPSAPVYREAQPEPVYRDAQPAAAGEMATMSIGEAARYDHVVVPKFVASEMKTTPAAFVERTTVPASNLVRDLLKTPGNLRAAILLREILGPAPGL